MKIKCKKLDLEAKLPTRKHLTDAGMDVYALEHTVINPTSYEIIKTGITFEFIENTVSFIWPKSRASFLIGAGVLDENFQGEVLVKIFNPSLDLLIIQKHDPIAQIVITPVLYPEIEEVDIIHEVKTDRGETGGIVGNST
jgi:dUTP pyrophosphatase